MYVQSESDSDSDWGDARGLGHGVSPKESHQTCRLVASESDFCEKDSSDDSSLDGAFSDTALSGHTSEGCRLQADDIDCDTASSGCESKGCRLQRDNFENVVIDVDDEGKSGKITYVFESKPNVILISSVILLMGINFTTLDSMTV